MIPFRASVAAFAATALLCGAPAASEESGAARERAEALPRDPATRELVKAHLKNAAVLRPSTGRPGSDEAIRKLKAEIEAKRQAWTGKLASASGREDLLAGIPTAVLERAKPAGGDAEKTREALKAGATLELVLALAAERNPEAAAAYENWRATLRRFEQASYLEDLVAQYRAFVRELDTKVGPQDHKEMLAKTFPFPSALALKGQAVEAEAEIARLEWLISLRKAVNEAARMCFEVQYASRAVALLREDRELVARMADLARNKLRAAEANRADVLKAETMLAMLDNRIVTTERRRRNSIAQANAMLGLPPDAEWGPAAETDLSDAEQPIDAILKSARAGSQELRKAEMDVSLMETMVRMTETMVYPRASAGYSQIAPSTGAEAGATRSEMAAFPDRADPDARASDFGPNAAYVDELRIRVRQARAMLEAASAQAAFAAKDAHFRADAARRDRKVAAETAVPKARQAFDTLKDRYVAGEAPFIEYLDAARAKVEATLLQEESRREHNAALIGMQDAIGRTAAGLLAKER